MTQVSHQTVRLSQGKHRGPDHGACVMELSSMLAGEPFSDRPRCVDPVIAGFLRTYNDGIDERRRQDLYPLAAEVVGTRAVAGVQAERARMCLALGAGRATSSCATGRAGCCRCGRCCPTGGWATTPPARWPGGSRSSSPAGAGPRARTRRRSPSCASWSRSARRSGRAGPAERELAAL